jgi:hypothetical protein
MNGWIVTWERGQEIVAAFNYRIRVERVRELVEQLYIALQYDEEDKLAYADRPKNNPYPAQVDQFSRVTCGHNPFLYARYVNNIRRTDDGYRWDEPNVQAIHR